MSGAIGVLLFIASLFAAWWKRPIAFGALFTFALVGLFVSVYSVWREEYVRNFAQAYVRFHLTDMNDIGKNKLTFTVNAQNETSHPATVESIDMVRLWVADTPPFIKLQQSSLICKELIQGTLKDFKIRIRELHDQPWRFFVAGRPDVWYQLLSIDKIKVDEIDKTNAETIIGPGAGHIFTIEASGEIEDRRAFPDIALCPVITFSTQSTERSIICPGAAQGRITFDNPSLSGGMDFSNPRVFPLRLPDQKEECKII